MSRSTTLARLSAEFVVIVTGVLVALAVDQWRESRDDRLQELQLLESFVLDLQLDSADYAVMPSRSLGRVRGAEILLRNLAPQMPRSMRALETVDSAGPYPVPASDEELVDALRQVEIDADLDVAQGAYAYFSAGGGLRLVRNAMLQHEFEGILARLITEHAVVRSGLGDGVVNLLRHFCDIFPRKMHEGVGCRSAGPSARNPQELCQGRMQKLPIHSLKRVSILS